MKSVILHREALEEFNGAAAHYQNASAGLGQRFYADIEQAIQKIRLSPATFRTILPPARRHLARDFPYGIVYIERAEDIWIIAVAHLHREPGYWHNRLPPP